MSNRGKEVQEEEGCEASNHLIMKAEIVSHPLFKDLLAAHVACIQAATSVNQQHMIDSSMANHATIIRTSSSKYSHQELDRFMVGYTSLLSTLQMNLQPCIVEAKMGLQFIEQELFKLTGYRCEVEEEIEEESWEEGDILVLADENEQMTKGSSSFIPRGSDKSSIGRMKQELKLKLQQDYERKIKHVREDILRRRKACKFAGPGDISSILKKWWEEHQDWPYPTNEEKEMLMRDTGLKPMQINKWFTNQRNRHWASKQC